jgi:hypothetical protein
MGGIGEAAEASWWTYLCLVIAVEYCITVLANIDEVASAHRTHVCCFFPRYLCAYEGDDFGAWWDAIHPKQTVAYRYDATMVVDDSVH